jgi:hypothetical protein
VDRARSLGGRGRVLRNLPCELTGRRPRERQEPNARRSLPSQQPLDQGDEGRALPRARARKDAGVPIRGVREDCGLLRSRIEGNARAQPADPWRERRAGTTVTLNWTNVGVAEGRLQPLALPSASGAT